MWPSTNMHDYLEKNIYYAPSTETEPTERAGVLI
jgi:hypothetical protein